MKTILPTTDRVVILPIMEKEKNSGLQIVRDHRNAEMQYGKIIAAGPEVSDKNQGLFPRLWRFLFGSGVQLMPEGTEVMFNPAAGTVIRRLKDDGVWEELRIMHADTLQCIIYD